MERETERRLSDERQENKAKSQNKLGPDKSTEPIVGGPMNADGKRGPDLPAGSEMSREATGGKYGVWGCISAAWFDA